MNELKILFNDYISDLNTANGVVQRNRASGSEGQFGVTYIRHTYCTRIKGCYLPRRSYATPQY